MLGSEARNFALATGSLKTREAFPQAALLPRARTPSLIQAGDKILWPLCLSAPATHVLVPVACTASGFLIFLTPRLAALTQWLLPQCLLPCPADLHLCSRTSDLSPPPS